MTLTNNIMKQTTLITAVSAVSAIAYAGEPVQPMQSAPAPAPVIGGWFVGGTYGQFETDSNIADIANEFDPDGQGFEFLANGYDEEITAGRLPSGDDGDYYGIDDFEFDMYTLHIGQDLGTQVLGCDLSAYLEVGYITGDADLILADFDSLGIFFLREGIDIDIIPITINLKAERMFFAGIKGYITAGVGYAFTKADTAFGDEDDGGFYAQAQIGLAYDINEQWEIYGGARWLYLSDLEFGVDEVELDDAVAYEIGLRYSF